jgi:phospholipid/cholesterol/gamma-HCH transport system ATP-binding protein
MTEPLIVVENLTKVYDEKVAISGISLRVHRGEAFVIIGASGSGKSVLLRNIVGLERPTSGHVYVNGVDITQLDDRSLQNVMRHFGIVFQKNALFDSMSVFDNVAYPLREQGVDRKSIERRVMAKLAELGLEGAAHKLPAEISGGMAKRAGIARALVTDPEIIAYDEPTAGLDPVTSRRVDSLIEETRQRFLVTSLVVTHDIATALSVGDRVALIDAGRIVFESDVAAAFDASNTEARKFFDASAVDPERLVSRANRPEPAEIESRWIARQAREAEPKRSRG